MKPKKKITPPTPETPEFEALVGLLAVYSDGTNQLANLQSVANDHLLEVLDDIKPQYAKLQQAVTEAEAAMEKIVLKHPEWFSEKKSIKTPYGTVKLHTSKSLAVSNEEAALARLELVAHKTFPGNGPEEVRARDEFIARYVRMHRSLNIEALEAEKDSFLEQLGIDRIEKQNFSAKPATLDLGKAVSETNAAEPEAVAA